MQLHAPVEFSYLGPKDAYSALLSQARRSGLSDRVRKDAPLFFFAEFFGRAEICDRIFPGALETLFHHAGRRLFQGRHRSVARRRCRVVLSHPRRHPRFRRPARTHERHLRPLRHARVPELRPRRGISSHANKVMITGSPLRTELLGERVAKDAAKEIMGFDKTQPLVLVLGGSQGAQRINEFVLANLPQFVAETSVLHQTGAGQFCGSGEVVQARARERAGHVSLCARGIFFGGTWLPRLPRRTSS